MAKFKVVECVEGLKLHVGLVVEGVPINNGERFIISESQYEFGIKKGHNYPIESEKWKWERQ